MEYCMTCERIDWIKNGKNPYFVKELNTGYVVIGDHQRIKGYSLFLCIEHATELHFLEPDFRDEFLHEMAIVAEAVYNAFKPIFICMICWHYFYTTLIFSLTTLSTWY